MTVINSTFTDSKGDYVRFRDVVYWHHPNYGSSHQGYTGYCDISNWPSDEGEVAKAPVLINSDLNNLFLICKKCYMLKALILINTIENQTIEFKGLTIEMKLVFSAMNE